MSNKTRILYDDDQFQITRTRALGQGKPARITVMAKKDLKTHYAFKNRIIELSIDELFDLTEHLDDICDYIEDETDKHKPA